MIVLIVEDEKNVTQVWKEFLEEIGEVRVAYDPEEGLRLMAQPPYPEVVLLDLSFPTSRADQTLSLYLPRFRAINPEATIVIITGNTEDAIMQLSKQLGADFFGKKPENSSSQSALLRAIKEGATALATNQPSYTQPLRVLELLNSYLHKNQPVL